MASVAGQKRKHGDASPVELSNGNVNLKASVDQRGTVTFAPLQNKPKWNIKLCLEDVGVNGVQYQPPNTISVEHEKTIRELVENIEGGIEHSFAIAEGPAQPFSLRLGVQTDGILSIAEHDSNLCFWGKDGPVFVYQNLVVHDATGRTVKSNMQLENEGPRIVLNVLEAPVFPILIDPLATIPGKALLPFKLPENLLSFLGPGAKIVDVTCSSTIANFAEESSSDSDEEHIKKKSKELSAPRKLGLPVFAKLFPSFRLPTQWLRSLYGGSKPEAAPLARGHNSLLSHSSLPHLDIGLDWEGNIRYDAKSWFLTVAPPALELGSAELLHGPNLQVLRADHAEIGISFYKDSARHFFLLSKPVTGKFTLNFLLNGVAQIEFDKDNHYLSLLEGGHPRLVYAAPLLRLPNGQTSVPTVEWQGTSLSIAVPSSPESFPLVLAFSVVGKKPSGPKSLATLFPGLKVNDKGDVRDSGTSSSSEDELPRKDRPKKKSPKEVEESSSEDESDGEGNRRKKLSLPSFSLKFPSLKSWTGFLYGPSPKLTTLKPGQPSSLTHDSLNKLRVDLAENGDVEYHAPNWKIKFATNFQLHSPKVVQGKYTQLVRGEDGETGLSFDPKHSRHFFIFSKPPSTPKLLLQLEQLEGSTSLEYDPERGFVAFKDQDNNLLLVYSSPVVILPSGEATVIPVEWDGDSSGIAVQLPAEAPLVVMFGITPHIVDDPLAFLGETVKRSPTGKLETFISEKGRALKQAPSEPKIVKELGLPKLAKSFGDDWASYYGDSDATTVELPAGRAPPRPHGHFQDIEVGLQHNGEVEFGSRDWKITLLPSLTLTNPKLYQRDKLQLLRGDDGEIGISVDKAGNTKHFFLFSKRPEDSRLLLKLEQLTGATNLEFNPNIGYIALSDQQNEGRFFIVYRTPVVLVPGREPIPLVVEWDGDASAIAVRIPEDLDVPFVVNFTIDHKIPEFGAEIGISPPANVGQISVPTFGGGNPSESWLSMLYGRDDGEFTPVPVGHPTIEAHPSLNNLEVTLAPNGEIDFGNATYKVKLTPAGFTVANPQLYRREGLQLLRADDVEIGLSFDKDTTRHFFLFPKNVPQHILLKLEQLNGSTKLEYNPEVGYVGFSDEKDHLVMAYSSPVVHLSSNETTILPVEWDAENSAISVKIPEGTTGPLLVAFGVAAKLPKSKRDFLSLLFPWLSFGERGGVDRKPDHKGKSLEPAKKPAFSYPAKSTSPVPKASSPVSGDRKSVKFSGIKPGVPDFALKWPTFDLGRTWISNLYGTAEEPLKPVTEELARHAHPSLGKLDVGISLKGEVEYSSPDWKVKFSPNFEISNPKLWTGSAVHLVRGDDGETGLSFDKHDSRHFVFFGKQPPEKFVLSFSLVEGNTKVEFNKEKKSIAFLDSAGKVRLVYSAPTAKLANNQTIILNIDWDPATSAIVVQLPEQNPPPMVLAFAVGLKYTPLQGEKRLGSTSSSRTSTPTFEEPKKEEPLAKISGTERKPSFSGVKFHNFKLDHSWMAELYGGSNPLLTAVPKLPKTAHPVLPNLEPVLAADGSVEYGSNDWKFKLVPIFVPTPPVPHRGDSVHLLRGEDGETGLYFDKVASRHFFIVGKPLTAPKFELKLTQVTGNTKIEFSKEKGFVAFTDPSGKRKVVYSAPRVQTGSGKNTTPPIEWDNNSATLSVPLPDVVSPVAVAFRIGATVAMGPKYRQRPGSQSYEPIDVDEEGKPKPKGFGLPIFMNKHPNFKLVRPWHEALYGPTDVPLTQIPAKQPHPIPVLNGLEVALNTGGDVDFGAQDWKIKLAPVTFGLAGGKLHKGDGLQIVRGDANEEGLSYDQNSLRHFYFFGKAPQNQKFSIKLTPLSGSVKVDLIAPKGVVTFSDHEGKLKFVYVAPVVLLASGKTVPVNINWDGSTNSLAVFLPEMAFPMVLAFGITGKVPESLEKSRVSSFPSFRFGPAGNIEVPANEEKERDIKVPTKTTTSTPVSASDKAKQFGFSLTAPTKPKLPKVTLPSFSISFPKNFKLGTSWTTTLYGRHGHNLAPVPEGQVPRASYSSFPHYEVGLSQSGEVVFNSPDWKLSAAPVNFKLQQPKLLKAEGTQLLRGDDGEIGVTFDETAARHFFFLGKAPTATKFSIKFTQQGAQIDFNKERGYLAFSKGPVPLVYYAPLVLLPNNKTVILPLEWDQPSTTLSVTLPDLSFPVVITFGFGVKLPDLKAKHASFPNLKISAKGEVESSDEEDEVEAGGAGAPSRGVLPVFKEFFPASYHKGIPSPLIADTLYGTSTVALTDVPSGQYATLKHPSLGLDVGLNHAGELEFASPTFKVKITPNVTLTAPKLLKRDGLQVLRAGDGEIGVSFDGKGPSRHFFILSKAPSGGKLSLTLGLLLGNVKLKFDKNNYVEVCDESEKTQFVYLSPIAQHGNKTITLPLEWNAQTNSLFVTLPESASYPLLIAFGVSPKTVDGTSRWSISFPSLRGRLTKSGEVDDSPEESNESHKKLVLPSFFSKFSPAKLLKWIATLYGPNVKPDQLVEAPEGETSLNMNVPSLGLTVSLNEDGEAEFGAPEWKGKFFPDKSVKFGRLLSHDGLQLLRHSDGEIGISHDKHSVRYFFVINSKTDVFKLNFEAIEGETRLQLFPDKGILVFADNKDKVYVVISSPLVLSGDKTFPVLLSWDGSISVPLPANTTFPAVITFGVSTKAPEPDQDIDFFRGIKIGTDGAVEGEDVEEQEQEEEEEEEEIQAEVPRDDEGEYTEDAPSSLEEKVIPSEHGYKPGKFEFSSRHPEFKLSPHWTTALYGVDGSFSEVPQGSASIFFHPSLGNLKVSLNDQGEVAFQDANFNLVLSAPCPVVDETSVLVEREGLQLLRNEHGELGVAFDKKGSRFFVILGSPLASPSLSLHFKIEPGTKVTYNKDKRLVVFLDKSDKPRLAFASPTGRTASNEDFTFPIEWDDKAHAINVTLPYPDVPAALAFALYPTPPPDSKKSSGSWAGALPEGWEPAVPGVDAPLYEYPKVSVSVPTVASPVSVPASHPSSHAAPARGSPSPPGHGSPSHGSPSPSSSPSIGSRPGPHHHEAPPPHQHHDVHAPPPARSSPSPPLSSSPTSSPSTGHKHSPTSGPSSAPTSVPSATEGKFGVASPLDDDLGPVMVAAPIHAAEHGVIEVEEAAPQQAKAGHGVFKDDVDVGVKVGPGHAGIKVEAGPVAIKVGLDSESSSSSESDGEGGRKKKEGKKGVKEGSSAKVPRSKEGSEKGHAKAPQGEKQHSDKDGAKAEKDKAKGEKDKADKDKADKEKAAKDKADKDKLEKEKSEHEKAAKEKEKADKAKADKDKADHEAAEKEKHHKEKADKEKADKEKADKDKADKAKADKDKADHEAAEKERQHKEKADKEKADKEKAEKDKADKAKADKDKADHELAEKERQHKEKADKEKADKEKADKEKADHAKAAQEKHDEQEREKERAHKEKADKEKAEKDNEHAAKQKAEKEKEDKDHAAKQKAEKEKEDKDHAAKQKAEKEKEDKDHAAKQKAEKEKEDKDHAAKQKAEKEKEDKDHAAKQKAEKEKEKEDKDHAAKQKAEKEKEDKDHAAKQKAEKEKEDKDHAAKQKAEKEKEDKDHAAKQKAGKADKEKEDKDHAAKQKAEKDKADKDHATKEKTDKEKAAKDEKERAKQAKDAEKGAKDAEKGKDKAAKGAKEHEDKDKARQTKEAKVSKEREEKDKATKERQIKEIAKLGPLPSASFDKGFRGALYGKVDLDNFVNEAPATTLYSATTNLTFELTAHDGVLSIGPSQGNAWHVRVVPVGLNWKSETAKLFKGSAFVSARSEGLEIGAQVREDSSSQFFVIGRGGSLTLRFETSGIGEIKYDEKDGETLFSDSRGSPLFIYSTPALHARSKSKKISSKTTWDNHKKELHIEPVGYAESVGIVCAICTKCITLPPDDVLYSLPDGSFAIVHPKVNFIGHASAAGIAYKSLTPEADPWSITLSLQGGKVHKVYAQSKCTVVLLRSDGIREYLAYVDRGGDYVGLHQSFHLHNEPSRYPIRVTIALTLEGITEIAQDSDSLITFSTKNGPVFAYGNVIVLDARGNTIASQIRLEDAESEHPKIVLEVLEEGEFPLVVG